MKNTGRFYIELTNECRFGSENDPKVVHWWRNFLNEASTIALEDNWPPVIPVTYGPGDGDSVYSYTLWAEALNRFASRGGLMGWHDYTPNPPGPDLGLCACDEWLGCRHRKNYRALLDSGVRMSYAITEAARSWGSSSVDEEDFVCYYGKIKNDPGLKMVAFWTAGFCNDPRWGEACLDGHHISIANKIVTN